MEFKHYAPLIEVREVDGLAEADVPGGCAFSPFGRR
jgi:hypothetical protein